MIPNKLTMTASFVFALFLLWNCGGNDAEKNSAKPNNEILASDGYQLIQQKCFICHLEKPDPSKKDQMIAPPMARIQEHYKPSHRTKEAFIQAITEWVSNPSEEKAIMPGAVRRFNLMPHLPYPKEEVVKIAEVLYDMNFDQMPNHGRGNGKGMGRGRGMMQPLTLNNGQKWTIKPETAQLIQKTIDQLDRFKSEKVEDYNRLGSEVFHTVKTIILDRSYEKNVSDQLHAFFHGVEGNLHFLISARTVDDAKKRQENLKKTFETFFDYFQASK